MSGLLDVVAGLYGVDPATAAAHKAAAAGWGAAQDRARADDVLAAKAAVVRPPQTWQEADHRAAAAAARTARAARTDAADPLGVLFGTKTY